MPATFFSSEFLLTALKTSPWLVALVIILKVGPQWVSGIAGWIDRWGERLLTERNSERERFFQELRDFETRCQAYSERIIGIVVSHQAEQMAGILKEINETLGFLRKEQRQK